MVARTLADHLAGISKVINENGKDGKAVRRFHQEWESKVNMPKTSSRRQERGISAQPLRILPVEESKLEIKKKSRNEPCPCWRMN